MIVSGLVLSHEPKFPARVLSSLFMQLAALFAFTCFLLCRATPIVQACAENNLEEVRSLFADAFRAAVASNALIIVQSLMGCRFANELVTAEGSKIIELAITSRSEAMVFTLMGSKPIFDSKTAYSLAEKAASAGLSRHTSLRLIGGHNGTDTIQEAIKQRCLVLTHALIQAHVAPTIPLESIQAAVEDYGATYDELTGYYMPYTSLMSNNYGNTCYTPAWQLNTLLDTAIEAECDSAITMLLQQEQVFMSKMTIEQRFYAISRALVGLRYMSSIKPWATILFDFYRTSDENGDAALAALEHPEFVQLKRLYFVRKIYMILYQIMSMEQDFEVLPLELIKYTSALFLN